MPKRFGKREMSRRWGLRVAFRSAARRGLLEDDADAWARAALRAGCSPEEVARLLRESAEVHWLAENMDALDSSNAFIEEHLLPLALMHTHDFENANPRRRRNLFTHPELSMIQISNAHVRASDTYLKDANSPAQSERGRFDCALDAGYLALLSVLTAEERDVVDHPSEHAAAIAAERLGVDAALVLHFLRLRHSAEIAPSSQEALAWALSVRERVRQLESN